MKINSIIFLAFIFPISLSGCGVGGWWMEGDPYTGRESFKPAYLRWYKVESDYKLSQRDWVECGGLENGMVTVPHENISDYDAEMKYDLKYDQVESCMVNKGYRYSGPCGGENGLRLRCRRSNRK